MAITSTNIKIDFTDPTVLADSEIGATQNFYVAVDPDTLLHQKQTPNLYLMEALNLNALNGTRTAATDSKRPVDVLATSENTSGGSEISLDFDAAHTTSGITLYFGDNVPKQVTVSWLDGSGVISSKNVVIHGDNFFFRNLVENYTEVKISGFVMQNPDRHARLQFVDYGEAKEWGEDTIILASIHESIDPISDKLEINTCSVKILDEAGAYNPDNQNGEWRALMRNQSVVVTEKIDGEDVPCGTFYVDKWDWQNNILSLQLQDAVGLLDSSIFYDGAVYSGEQAGTIIRSIMASAGWERYTVDTEIARTRIFGHLPVCSCREALQAVCFATGATCDDSRSDTIEIGMRSRAISKYIGTDKKFYGATKSSRAAFVSNITVSCKRYIQETETSEAFSGTLPAGVSRVQFGSPYATIDNVTGGTVVSSGENYCVVNMSAAGDCVIIGKRYNSEDFAVSMSQSISAGETENNKTYSAKLYPSNPATVAAWLQTYFSWRRELSTRIIATAEQVGDWCGVIDTNGQMTGVFIESQTIDLTGGFLSDLSGRGYSEQIGLAYYTGNDDLYMAEDIII